MVQVRKHAKNREKNFHSHALVPMGKYWTMKFINPHVLIERKHLSSRAT